mmetsp:Transcript_54749/g.128072  ORF Transcript_54749/g.128072 Transcript_54749/m.128072 type:complete len:200 (+) Transcript_54749:2474-3073(+)
MNLIPYKTSTTAFAKSPRSSWAFAFANRSSIERSASSFVKARTGDIIGVSKAALASSMVELAPPEVLCFSASFCATDAAHVSTSSSLPVSSFQSLASNVATLSNHARRCFSSGSAGFEVTFTYEQTQSKYSTCMKQNSSTLCSPTPPSGKSSSSASVLTALTLASLVGSSCTWKVGKPANEEASAKLNSSLPPVSIGDK